MPLKIHIAENISRFRKQKGLMQEDLAQRLGVSAQAVSNWERGGYPDITLLPALAAHLGLTIDALMGNGPEQQTGELAEVERKSRELYDSDPAALIEYIKPYYYKYPHELWIADLLCDAIIREKTHLRENYPLVKEASKRVLKESEYRWDRERAIWFMCMASPDDELEEWQNRCPDFYSSTVSEILEQRFKYHGRNEELLARHYINNFKTFCHLCLREDITNPSALLSFDPEKAVGEGKFIIKAIKDVTEIDGEPAPAWYGALGEFSARTSWQLFALGEIEEGYKYLEDAFYWYEKWTDIPEGTLMDVGDRYAFGGIKIKKCTDYDCWHFTLPDGSTEWHPYGLLFTADKFDLYQVMTVENGGGWYTGCDGFDCVRGEERFKELVGRAERIRDK